MAPMVNATSDASLKVVDAPQQQKRVEVNMRVEEREPKSRENGCSEVGACLVVENHGRGVASREKTKHAVTGDKRSRAQG